MLSTRKAPSGQTGTKKLHAQYGDRLLCVRYRYDRRQQKRFKTIEPVIEKAPWTLPPEPYPVAAVISIRIELQESELQRRVKRAGGKWNPERRLWEMRYDQAVALGLEDRIEQPKVSISRNQRGVY